MRSLRQPPSMSQRPCPPSGGLTAIVPAYNEAGVISEAIRSLQHQTIPPEEIIVVDDASDDGTGEIARGLGATVIRPPANTGSKAGAQTFALGRVHSEFIIVVDADTTLAPDALENIMPAFSDDNIASVCGFVLPRYVRSVWERGRYIEYVFAFSFHKQIQDFFHKPLISSGCFSVYKTEALRRMDGWKTRTMAEDVDLTWSLYEAGWGVRFVPEAVCYPIEPHSFNFMCKQLRRWSHGFVQNLKLHWRRVRSVKTARTPVGYLQLIIAVWFAETVGSSLMYLVLLPLLAVVVSPYFLLAYVIDAPVLLVPVLAGAAARGEVTKALASFPAFFVTRLLSSVFALEALWSELVLRRPLAVYEKGH